jgi:hypothetical protein
MAGHAAFAELVRALAREQARALVVGSMARRIHGWTTRGHDCCLWYDTDDANPERVYRALARVGAPLDGVAAVDLADVAYEFRYGAGETEICLRGGLDGVTFADAWPERIETTWGEIVVSVIGRDALRASELAERA